MPSASGRTRPSRRLVPSTLPDIGFDGIAARGGSQATAFEELCCYLVEAWHPDRRGYRRFHGAGGDGGVECLIELADGQVIGIQVKYMFDVRRALTKAKDSFSVALRQHPGLTKLIVCLPMDPTGPTARKGRSGTERIEEWIRKREADAIAQDRRIQIEFWTASTLRSRLLEDGSEVAIRYYFDKSLLTDEWWRDHRRRILDLAGPRYTPQSPVETTPVAWFRAFGRVEFWRKDLKERIAKFFDKTTDDLEDFERGAQQPARTSTAPEGDGWSPAWPGEALPHLSAAIGHARAFRQSCDQLVAASDGAERGDYHTAVLQVSQFVENLRVLEQILSDDLDRRHYPGASSSPGFRQAQAEWGGSLPAANLDGVRRVLEHADALWGWLGSPRCSLAFEEVFFLTGRAGAGKTHTICDVLERRAAEDLPAVAVLGHRLDPARPLDRQLTESLGLPADLTLPAFLDLLDADGRTRSAVTLICLDAVDEAGHRERWPGALRELVSLVKGRRWLRLCITCRTSFAETCLPDSKDIPTEEHPGFGDLDRGDVAQYLAHYGLREPTTPTLPPEFFDPLYLRLTCQAAHDRGLRAIPSGWLGIRAGIVEFLNYQEREFSDRLDESVTTGVVTQCLTELAGTAEGMPPSVSRQDAVIAIRPVLDAKGYSNYGSALDWLVRADLLIEEGVPDSDPLSPSTRVRFGYGRLRDFLLARRLVANLDADALNDAAAPGGALHKRWATAEATRENSGVIEALSILIPETHPGIEAPDLVLDPKARVAVLKAWSQSLVSRDSTFYRRRTVELAREALRVEECAHGTLDALLANCWRESLLDIRRVSALLRSLPMAQRDARWCPHLHESYERHGAVFRLIAATHEFNLSNLDPAEADRWVTALLWFTAAADGRVRDRATRSAIRLFFAHPDTIPRAVERFVDCDDDLVKERTLLSAYGALMGLADPARTRALAEMLREKVTADREAFDNAVLRDVIHCITDLANHLQGSRSLLSPDYLDGPLSPDWIPEIPTADECKRYRIHKHFQPVEFLSDFVKYTLWCLSRWEQHFSKEETARWMVRYISVTLGYETSECFRYDDHIVRRYGPGREKPVWAERIGKKYQRIALQRLASRFHDHVDPSPPRRESSSHLSGLILSDERLFDPTIREAGQADVSDDGTQMHSLRIGRMENGTDKEWLAEEGDLPDLRQLLSVVGVTGRQWWTLLAYWSGEDAAPWGRQRWAHAFAYLVDSHDFRKACQFLDSRNFYGNWMPDGHDLSGFLAEYPWGAVFANAGVDRSRRAEHTCHGYQTETSSVPFEPAWNRIFVENRFDTTMSEPSSVHVPSPTWFDLGDLAWNHRDGYRRRDGKTVFCDPSATGGAARLVADPEDLSRRLADCGKRLIWTVLGEKLIAEPEFREGRTFSQVAYLGEDGEPRVGRRLFLDYRENKAGPEFKNHFVHLKKR